MATIHAARSHATLSRPLASVRRGLVAIVEVLHLWQSRADERLWLAQMDDHMLKDIGLSRADIQHETDKPFWKP